MTKKKAIIAIGAVAIFIILYRYLPLLIIAGGALFIIRYNRKQIPEKPKPKRPRIEAEPTDYLQVQATVQEAQKVIDEHNDIIRSTDLRQFKGRTDVTKEELATYMFEQHYWNGAYERRTMMEEIVKHCNLSIDDIEWCEDRLRHYTFEYDPYHEYTACVVMNEEAKAISDYTNEQESARIKQEVAKLIKEHKAHLEFIKQDDINGELAKIFTEQFNRSLRFYATELRRYDYDAWLKMKGYVK